jgi:hypothetical protein
MEKLFGIIFINSNDKVVKDGNEDNIIGSYRRVPDCVKEELSRLRLERE